MINTFDLLDMNQKLFKLEINETDEVFSLVKNVFEIKSKVFKDIFIVEFN